MTAPRFINSAIVRVPEGILLRGASWRPISVGVRYGLLVHPTFGPVLIDTGYGPRATRHARRSPMLKAYGAVLRPKLIEEDLPLEALARAGFGAEDVRRIVVTHFHPDHVAALRDFPNATFITSAGAWTTVRSMNAAARIQRGVFIELLPDNFGSRVLAIEGCATRDLPFGLGEGRDIWDDGSCLAVDLPGHAIGHFGLIWPRLDPPLFYATDVTWLSEALEGRLPGGIARIVYEDDARMRASAAMVRAFEQAGGRVVLCHDRVPA